MSIGRSGVALSVKRLQPDPWATVAARYEIGQVVDGLVTTVVDFGVCAAGRRR
jgi:small subunit ribosomal protein S1